MGKSSNTTTQSKTYNPAAMGAYQDVMSRAQGVASTPYQAYGGELTAGINPYQQQAFGQINQAAGFATPYIQEGADFARSAAGPITDADISRYTNPYTQRVVDATQRQFETQNAREQSSLVGNAAAKGALGGDRVSVAQSTLAGEHARAQDPVIAGLYSQGYQGALAAAQAEAQRKAQAGGQLAGFGVSGAQAGLAGGQAMLGAGTLQQQTEQQRLQALYGQYQMAQAYPYQQAQWLAGITTGVGSQMGGTTTGEMTKPPPDPWATAAGLGLGAAGMFLSDERAKSDIEQIGTSNDGLPIYRFKYSGDPSGKTQIGLMAQDVEKVHPEAVAEIGGLKHIDPEAATEDAARAPRQGFADGGAPVMPWGGARGWIPQAQIVPGKTEPELDKWSADKDQTADLSKYGQLGASIGKKALGNWGGLGGALGSAGQDYSLTGTGGSWARGGGVWMPGGYANGGDPDTFDDRFDAAFPNKRAPAFAEAVRGFAPAVAPLAPSRRLDEGWEESRKAMEGPEATWRPWTRGASDSPGIPQYPESVGFKPPEPPPLPRPRPAIAGVAGPTEEPVLAGLPPATSRPPAMPAEEEPYRPPSDYPAPTAFRPSGEGTPDTAAPRRGFGLLGKIDDATGQALMAAGFGMMASRSPHLGVAIGEGGLTGLSAYAGARGAERQAEEQKLTRAQEKRKFDLDVAKLDEAAKHHSETIRMAERQRTAEEMKPVVIHETRDKYGQVISSIKGVRDPVTGGYRVINPDGTLSSQTVPASKVEGAPGVPGTLPGTPKLQTVQSEEDQGIIPKNAQLVSSGNYDYSTGAPDIERGMDVPSPQATSGYSPQGIRTHAENYILSGTLPKVTFGSKGAAREQQEYVKAVQNYGNALAASRGIDPKELPELWRGSKGFQRYALGADGRTTTALGTAIRHLDTVDQLAKALAANDTRAINVVRTFLSRQFGGNGATDLMTAAKIVGPEVIKAIGVAGAGTGGEREAMEAFLDPRASPAQIAGSILTLQKLLGGQLEGKRANAVDVTKVMSEDQFKSMVGARPYEILRGLEKTHGLSGDVTAAPAKIVQPPGIPAGSQYSPSRKMWRDPDGEMYDASGKPVQ